MRCPTQPRVPINFQVALVSSTQRLRERILRRKSIRRCQELGEIVTLSYKINIKTVSAIFKMWCTVQYYI